MLQVKLEQGLEMLKIFKEHVTKTSILDDFGFYENRQKLMQEKRANQQLLQGQASICSYYSFLWFCMAWMMVSDALFLSIGQGADVSQEKDKDATNGKPGSQKQATSKEGTPAEVAADASKPVAESGISNDN
jgi:YTH domain-containing family protein